MQRNDSADRTTVAGYSGDEPPVPRKGVFSMYLIPLLMLILLPVEWVVTALLVYFSIKQ